MNIQRPILICGCHKSGTSLLRSLFDAVPGFFVLPMETHFFQAAKYLITYPYRKTAPGSLTPVDLATRLEESVVRANSHTDTQSYGVLAGRIDVEKFSEVLVREAPRSTDLRQHFVAFARACHKAMLGSKLPQNVRIVEKSVENAEVASYWLKLFPEASFVHIIRNPYANLVSLRKYKSSGGRFPYLRKPMQALSSSFDYLYRNQVSLPRYVVVRYEDLVSDVHAQMMAICDQLGIEYDGGMTRPTFLGEPWGGNSTSGRTFEGVSESRADAWKREITPLEIEAVNRCFKSVLRDYRYPVESRRRGLWQPRRGESVRVYLRNRGMIADLR